MPGHGGRVPLLLAALAPAMLRLAAEQADGTVLWMTGPATVRDYVVPALAAAARDAGRPDPRVVCVLPVCVTDDPDLARTRADRIFAIYGQLPSYRAMLDREGAAGPADVAMVGDEATVRGQIEGLAEAGVTDYIAADFSRGDDAPRTRALLKSCASASAVEPRRPGAGSARLASLTRAPRPSSAASSRSAVSIRSQSA